MKMKKKPTHLKIVKPAADPELEAAKAILRPMAEGKRSLRPRPNPRQPATMHRRKTATFFMMDHDILSALGRALNYPALVIISELDRRVFTGHRNPTTLPSATLVRLGVGKDAKSRALQDLAKVGMISVISRRGRLSLITWNNPARSASPVAKE